MRKNILAAGATLCNKDLVPNNLRFVDFAKKKSQKEIYEDDKRKRTNYCVQ